MRIIRFPDANKTDITNPTEKIIDRIDAWRCNGNPNIEVTLYDNLPPLFFPDSRSDGSAAAPSSAPDSEEVCPMPLREREPGSSDFFGKKLVME